MASSVGTPSSSSSAVPSIDLLTCFIKALIDDGRDETERERKGKIMQYCPYINVMFVLKHNQYLMDSVSMCTGAILSSRNLTISRNGLLGCLGLPSFLVMSRWKQYENNDAVMQKNWQSLSHTCHFYTLQDSLGPASTAESLTLLVYLLHICPFQTRTPSHYSTQLF